MSDEGEKTCPLCAEEMDLTDQQLKPCKCGYEICVWCWHHIMNMAEKDAVEGRCPACRTPYNKEKIVGTMPNCERMVAEMNMEKKLKSQKTKGKTSDSRKQLNNMRVIQKNLVYVVGLPLNLADEELLQGKEHFGQYGRVLKVSISRTAAGAIQQFANSTCSVYITYSQEAEAICCIQSVHGFVLDGRPLRACFGTTKYCHAWLRNVPCTNPDCLYLHEVGSQEDSFTKDEVISAYTRSRVQQITGATSCVQRRSGALLPPPADDYCHNDSALAGKPISKSTNIPATSARVSPPNSVSGRSAALPAGALWGTRPSNSQPPSASSPCPDGSLRAKPDKCSDAVNFSTAVGKNSILDADPGKQLIYGEESSNNQDKSKIKTSQPANQYAGVDKAYVTETPATPVLPSCSSGNSQFHGLPASKEKDGHTIKPSNPTSFFDHSMKSKIPGSRADSDDTAKIETQILCPDMSTSSIDRLQKSQQSFTDQSREPLSSKIESKVAVYSDVQDHLASDMSDLRLDLQSPLLQAVIRGNGDNSLSAYDQRPRDAEASTDRSHNPKLSESFHSSTQCPLLSDNVKSIEPDMQIVGKFDSILPSSSIQQISDGYRDNIAICKTGLGSTNLGIQQISDGYRDNVAICKTGLGSTSSGIQQISDGYRDNVAICKTGLGSTNRSCFSLSNVDQRKEMRSFEGGLTGASRNIVEDMEESSIISNILSLDDPWGEPLTSPQNLAKLLGDTDKQPPLSSFKLHSSNQSRFSFAREEEEPISQKIDLEPSLCHIEQAFNNLPSHIFSSSRGFQPDNLASRSDFSLVNEDSNSFSNSYLSLSNQKSSVSRSEMSAPPGFSATSKALPPIFMSHNRVENNFDSLPGNYTLQTPMSRNQYQAPPSGNMVGIEDDILFIDPAILAVHKGTVPTGPSYASGLNATSGFPLQLSTSEFLVQRSLSSPLKNQRFPDTADSFSAFGDAYRIPSGILGQSLSSNLSPFSSVSVPESRSSVMSSGNWDSWNRITGRNDLGVSELLQTERLGLNKLYTGYEDSKFGMTNPGNLYGRAFGF